MIFNFVGLSTRHLSTTIPVAATAASTAALSTAIRKLSPTGQRVDRLRPKVFQCFSSSMSNSMAGAAETMTCPWIDSCFETVRMSKSLLALVSKYSERIQTSSFIEASLALEEVIVKYSINNLTLETLPEFENAQERLSNSAVIVALDICHTNDNVDSMNGKERWHRLQNSVARLLTRFPSQDTLSIATIYCCFSLINNDASKAAASCLSLCISKNNKMLQGGGLDIVKNVLQALLLHASSNVPMSLHTIVQVSKAFHLDNANGELTELSASVIRHVLGLDGSERTSITNKEIVTGALALACQLSPWPLVPPISLVNTALSNELWSTAVALCRKAHESALLPRNDPIASESYISDAVAAVEYLINALIEDKRYRIADQAATNLYDIGGKTRFVEARMLHAYDTIRKLIVKQRLAMIEQQVARVDKAVEVTQGDFEASNAVRTFVLQQLEMAGEVEGAHRIATLWNLDYTYDEGIFLAAVEARRQKYLQWDDVSSGAIPELLSTPDDLLAAFEIFRSGAHEFGPFGFDAEWDDDSDGAAILQLARLHHVLLIDIPALSLSVDGVAALKNTAGKLMNCHKSIVVGFSCRQDLSRLRASPCVGKVHWLSSANAVIDAQGFIADSNVGMGSLGLSKVAEVYLGKPLDKTEQCSLWSTRPLSERQREYAALDAWVCVALHQKFFPKWPSQVESQGEK